jgi:DNA repair protein RecN (Recombination protein N)
VFDEIDVGVSGRVAQAIADKLHQLSRRHQVLCVTHQPIIAAMADLHYRVNKEVIDPTGSKKGRGKVNGAALSALPESTLPEDVRTVVRVLSLDDRQRREELAQLAGGKTDPDAIAFADSLLAQAATARLGFLPQPAAKRNKAKAKR